MNIHYSVVLKVTGIIMMVVGISMLPSFLVSLLYQENQIALQFIAVITGTFFIGLAMALIFRKKRPVLKLRDGFLIVAISWLVASILGAIPYMTSGILPNFWDAFFESMSGFSTTGATVIDDVESLPRGILFWRSYTQWLGGVGILIFAIGLMPSLGVSGQNVMSPETPNLSLGRITNRMTLNIKFLYVAYGFFTILEAIMLKLCGLGWYDAISHTFTTVSTGGFSTYNEGISHFDSISVQLVIMLFMLISGINYTLYSSSLKRGVGTIFKDVEFRFYMIAIGICAMLITIFLHVFHEGESFGTNIVDGFFQTISIISTTGFTTTDFAAWPHVCVALLLTLMFIGGCSSSTSGGIKAIRILVVLRFIAHGIHNRLHPYSVEPITINGNSVPSTTVSGVAYHIFLYGVMLFGGAFIISFDSSSLEECFTIVMSCMGNIGPAFGDGNMISVYADFHPISKLVLSFAMLAGRLELYTLFIICTPRFWNPDN